MNMIVAVAVALVCLAGCGDDDRVPRDSGSDASARDTGAQDAALDTSADASGSLVWQDPPAPSVMTQDAARAYCEGLMDGADDWRLPTITELRNAVAGCVDTEIGGACNLVDEDGRASAPPYTGCDGCAAGGGPGDGGCYWMNLTGTCGRYWSATALSDTTFEGHALDFDTASIMTLGWGTTSEFEVRCVRP